MGTDQESKLKEAGVHLEPRRSAQHATESPTNPDQPPTRREIDATFLVYPRWVTLSTRGILVLFQLASLIYGLWFYIKWGSYQGPKDGHFRFQGSSWEFFPKSRYDLVLAAVGSGLGMDLVACILSFFGVYGNCWMWFVFLDIGVGVMGILGSITITLQYQNGFSNEELGWFWADDGQLLATFALVVGYVWLLCVLAKVPGFLQMG